jgi:hypothetical protein
VKDLFVCSWHCEVAFAGSVLAAGGDAAPEGIQFREAGYEGLLAAGLAAGLFLGRRFDAEAVQQYPLPAGELRPGGGLPLEPRSDVDPVDPYPRRHLRRLGCPSSV